MSPRLYPKADIKRLYGRAAGRCAFPKCRKKLILDEAHQIGKIAHIVAHSDSGPRSDPLYPKDKLDTYENWVLLCPTCHDTVDAQDSKYGVEYLRDLKLKHEQWAEDALCDAMPQIGFAELEIAIKGIQQLEIPESPDFSIISPDEKINKNGLSETSRRLIRMGLMQCSVVRGYLESMEQLHCGFIDKIIVGFKKKYQELRCDKDLNSDAIFDSLFDFSCGNQSEFTIRAAGLALLSHLFETCEVFEK